MLESVENIKNLVTGICRKYAVKSLYLIGSGSRNGMRAESDVDLLYSFQEGAIAGEGYAEHLFLFKDSLQRALKKKVNFIAQDYLRNPYFIKSIDKDKTLIYEA